MNKNIEKNLLDLEYNKNLQYFNTCIITILTYIVGLMIAIITEQINPLKFNQAIFTLSISLTFMLVLFRMLYVLRKNLDRITNEIRELKI